MGDLCTLSNAVRSVRVGLAGTKATCPQNPFCSTIQAIASKAFCILPKNDCPEMVSCKCWTRPAKSENTRSYHQLPSYNHCRSLLQDVNQHESTLWPHLCPCGIFVLLHVAWRIGTSNRSHLSIPLSAAWNCLAWQALAWSVRCTHPPQWS